MNRGVCSLIGSLQFGSGHVGLGGFAVEEAIGEWAADALMEEDKHEGDANAFFGEAVGIAMAVAFEQGMGFEFAQVIAQLSKGVALRSELVGGEDGLMDLRGTPAAELGAAMEQDFHETEHTGVVDLDTRDFAFSRGNG